MALMNMAKAINVALFEAMERDKKVIMMGEDVGPDEGVFRITEGLHHKFGDKRVLDTPLAESGIIGTAIGMAIFGLGIHQFAVDMEIGVLPRDRHEYEHFYETILVLIGIGVSLFGTFVFAMGFAPKPVPRISRFTPKIPVNAPP